MKKYSKVLVFVLAILMVAMCLTACAPKTMDRIKSSGKLVMLTNAAFPPYEYLGEDNEIVGIDIQVAQAIADELGVELQVENMDFDSLLTALQSGKGDIVAAGLTIDEERKKNVDFSIQYATSNQYIIVKADNDTIQSAEDLNGKAVGVQASTTGDMFVSDNTTAEVSQMKTALDAALALQSGKLDAVVIDELTARAIVAKNPDLKVVENKLTEEQYAIAIAKGNEDLVEVVNQVLTRLMEEGKIEEWTAQHNAV